MKLVYLSSSILILFAVLWAITTTTTEVTALQATSENEPPQQPPQKVIRNHVQGAPEGYGTDTVGGGTAAAVTPTTPEELKSYLEDDEPRVILLDREYNFIGTEGTCVDCPGCIPASDTCEEGGQLAINQPDLTWCDDYPPINVTYDKAAILGITVNSNKSVVGLGDKGVIRGKGLRMVNGVENVIIQNIAITYLNPEYIWGGDAITLDGSNKIWIDHVKISLIGRQMLVTGFESSGYVTVSNNDFDGRTSWSATCDGHHYWTVIGYGKGDMITFMDNYIHHTSGRSPKVEYNDVWDAVNNYWFNNTGHAFDIGQGAQILIEGNVFDHVKITSLNDSHPGVAFAPVNRKMEVMCISDLGRHCETNEYIDAPVIEKNSSEFLVNFKEAPAVARTYNKTMVKEHVTRNAGPTLR